MKKIFLYIAMALMPVAASAQQTTAATASQQTAAVPLIHFGYISYDEVLRSMSDYTIAQHNMDELRKKYDDEMKRVETEFNSKYEEFLDGQRSFAPSILEKRQAELKELLEKNMAFRAEAQRLLKQAEEEAYAPLKAKIQTALDKVAKAKGLAFVLNTDNNAAPYVNPTMGEDVTAQVKEALK